MPVVTATLPAKSKKHAVIRWSQRLVMALLPVIAAQVPAGGAPPDNSELVRLLAAPETRLRAYQELYRRTEPKRDQKNAGHYINPEVVICPQPVGSPNYIVLCDSLPPEPAADEDSFGGKNFDRLFPTGPLAPVVKSPQARKYD